MRPTRRRRYLWRQNLIVVAETADLPVRIELKANDTMVVAMILAG